MRSVLILMLAVALSTVANADQASHDAAAKRLIEVSRTADMMDTMYDAMSQQIPGMFGQMGVDEDLQPIMDRHMDRVFDVMREEMRWDKMEPMVIQLYVTHYTEEELNEMTGFYESPVGQKLLDKMPEVMGASMEMAQEMMKGFYARLPELQEALEADIEAARAGKD